MMLNSLHSQKINTTLEKLKAGKHIRSEMPFDMGNKKHMFTAPRVIF